MPRIPTYQRQQSISAGITEALPNINASAPLAGAGLGLSKAVSDIADHELKLKREDQHYQTVRFGTMVDSDALEFEQEEKNKLEVDSFGSMKRVDDWSKRMSERYTAQINDETTKRNVLSYIGNKSNSLKNNLAVHEASQRDVVAKNVRYQALEQASKNAYTGQGTLDDNFNAFTAVVSTDQRMGDEERETLLMKGQSAIAESRLSGIIDRNPQAGIDIIKSGIFNQYLDGKTIETMTKDAKTRQSELDRKSRQELEASQNETGNDFIEKLVNGELTRSEILRSNLNPTGENSKEHWIKQLAERDKKSTDTWKTDPAVEAEYFSKLTTDPKSVTKDELLKRQGSGLSTDTVKELMKYKDEVEIKNPLNSEQAKAAIKRVNDAKTAKIFSGNKEENSKKWSDAIVLLKRFIVNHPNEDPTEYVDKLLEEERDGAIRRFLDFLPGVDPYQSPEERRQELEGMVAPNGAAFSGINPDTGQMEYFDKDGNRL